MANTSPPPGGTPTAGGSAAGTATDRPFLEVKDLRVHFPTDDGLVKSVDGLSFSLERGRTLGIVGESGSGKSVSSLSIMGRGRKMAMIFQDPLSSMHPYFKIGNQIVEAYRLYNDVSKKVARQHAIDLLGRVGIPSPSSRVDDYPHQFSGGMRQRAMIAMALACDPELLIADEPTTALDVTVQAEILDLIRDLQREFGSAVIMITHDLGVIAELADDVLVMYGGKAVEHASCRDIFRHPEHPYTWGLLSSMPRMDRIRQERLIPVPGTPPSLISLPPGCAFNPRCRYCELTDGKSLTEVPALLPVANAPHHDVACHLPSEKRRAIWSEEVSPKL
jgi:peptide/nickel transport system ATP-binding protein